MPLFSSILFGSGLWGSGISSSVPPVFIPDLGESFYISIFYGGGNFYGGSSKDVPIDLRFYRTNIDNRYVFHWSFRFDFISPALASLMFELQIADDPLFTTNVLTYTNISGIISYQNGNVRKGFTIDVTPRLDKQEQIRYARVRTVSGMAASDWSQILIFVIPKKFELQESENIINNLPDFHVYGKEDLLKTLANRKSNLYTVANMYGKELDLVELENILTTTNNFIDLCRDEYLFDNFGYNFNYIKPQSQQFIEYRMCLLNLILASLVGGTIDAIDRIVRCFTGVNPNLQLIRERNDFFLDTILEIPGGAINGVNNAFTTSSDYIINTLTVWKNGLLLTSGVDYTENHALPGFQMTVPPSPGSTLEVVFRVGISGDPEPLVYDMDDTTPLTGTFTFTNNSTTVTGAGTVFTTELSAGDAITDNQGLVLGVVDSITSNILLTLTEPWFGDTASGNAKKLVYTESEVPPSILWDLTSLAHGLNIEILNPGLFNLNRKLIESLIKLIIPAHVKVFFSYP
jgi:hypothetical protein